MLQKLAETLEYEHLLQTASKEPESLKRIAYVAAFSVAQFASMPPRRHKPFNPILGETYELRMNNWRFFSEQVCHHPPISACFADSPFYEFRTHTAVRTRFWGKSMEFHPLGGSHCKLKDTAAGDEEYIFSRPVTSANNIIVGTLYLDLHGQTIIKNLTSGEVVELEFVRRGWLGKNAYVMRGEVKDKDGVPRYRVNGLWNEQISISNIESGEETVLWRANTFPKDFEWYYMFTEFGMNLNHLNERMRAQLPPTDSRFRPDQRALENGDQTTAANEKLRLEDKQRKARKKLEEQGLIYRPLFFTENVNEHTGEQEFLFNHKYKFCAQDWSGMPDIF